LQENSELKKGAEKVMEKYLFAAQGRSVAPQGRESNVRSMIQSNVRVKIRTLDDETVVDGRTRSNE
jgi:hypothetical protein